jgi:hypothetical protein
MALTTTVKRAPRWAWYIAGGVGLGAIGIEVYKRRAVDTPAPGDASSGADVIGTPTGSAAPSPVITPPVIVQQPGSGPDFAGIFGSFSDIITTGMATIGSLAAGDQGLAGTAISIAGDTSREAIAAAGQAPAPAVSTPTPIIVQVPTPATPATVSTPGCPAGFPRRTSRGCMKCERNSGSNKRTYPYVHVYQNGTRIAVTEC